MKISTVWKRNTERKKKNRPAYKPKIRWELLGLSDPDVSEPATPIDTIRREVSSLASRGLGQATRARSTEQDAKGGRKRQTGRT
jgi:hypothetical protein